MPRLHQADSRLNGCLGSARAGRRDQRRCPRRRCHGTSTGRERLSDEARLRGVRSAKLDERESEEKRDEPAGEEACPGAPRSASHAPRSGATCGTAARRARLAGAGRRRRAAPCAGCAPSLERGASRRQPPARRRARRAPYSAARERPGRAGVGAGVGAEVAGADGGPRARGPPCPAALASRRASACRLHGRAQDDGRRPTVMRSIATRCEMRVDARGRRIGGSSTRAIPVRSVSGGLRRDAIVARRPRPARAAVAQVARRDSKPAHQVRREFSP